MTSLMKTEYTPVTSSDDITVDQRVNIEDIGEIDLSSIRHR